MISGCILCLYRNMNNTCTNMFWLPHRHYKTIFLVSDQGSTSNVFQLLAMADLKEYSKHCCASLEGIKRRFDIHEACDLQEHCVPAGGLCFWHCVLGSLDFDVWKTVPRKNSGYSTNQRIVKTEEDRARMFMKTTMERVRDRNLETSSCDEILATGVVNVMDIDFIAKALGIGVRCTISDEAEFGEVEVRGCSKIVFLCIYIYIYIFIFICIYIYMLFNYIWDIYIYVFLYGRTQIRTYRDLWLKWFTKKLKSNTKSTDRIFHWRLGHDHHVHWLLSWLKIYHKGDLQIEKISI